MACGTAQLRLHRQASQSACSTSHQSFAPTLTAGHDAGILTSGSQFAYVLRARAPLHQSYLVVACTTKKKQEKSKATKPNAYGGKRPVQPQDDCSPQSQDPPVAVPNVDILARNPKEGLPCVLQSQKLLRLRRLRPAANQGIDISVAMLLPIAWKQSFKRAPLGSEITSGLMEIHGAGATDFEL